MKYPALAFGLLFACTFSIRAMYWREEWRHEDIQRQKEQEAWKREYEINKANATWQLIVAARKNDIQAVHKAIAQGASVMGNSISRGCMSSYDDEPICTAIDNDSVDVFRILKAKYSDPLFPRQLDWKSLAQQSKAHKILAALGY